MTENIEIIKKCSLFVGMSDEDISEITECLSEGEKNYPKGCCILHAGSRTNSAGLVLSGSVLIVQEDFWGNRNIVAGIESGDMFAESFACTPNAVMNVSVFADTPCRVLWLNIRKLLENEESCVLKNKVIMNMLTELSEKNLRFSEKLSHMGKRTTREKLLSYLSSVSQKKGGKAEFDIPFSRQQLADYLSVERSAMSAELGRLRDEGLINFNKSHFILHLSEDAER